MLCSIRSGLLDCTAQIGVRRLQAMLRLLPILLLAACGQQGAYGPGGRIEIGADGWRRPTQYYPPPGPAEDPWGPYIHEASTRYRVPERWVRAVMRQESGGEQQATSPVGAMGLMQVMPMTYEELRVRHRLGDDPYDPHNNILAGTAYIREMYDRYGAPGFLAAYNAGPDRVDSYLAGRAVLPDETVNYLAAITPNLGNDVPLSGRFAVASARSGRAGRTAPTIASLAAGCDLNAAYNPNRPCTSLERAATQPAPIQTAMVPQLGAPQLGANGCDLDAAYDPNHPCTSQGQVAAIPPPASVQRVAAAGCDPNAAYNPNRPCYGAVAVSGATASGAPGPARPHQLAAAAPTPYYQATTPSPRRLGDPSGGLRQSGPGSRGGGRRPRPGAGAARRRPGLSADGAVRRQGSLSRSPCQFVGQCGDDRVHPSQPPPAPLHGRPAERRLNTELLGRPRTGNGPPFAPVRK